VDSSLVDLVELEARELLEKYSYPSNTPFIRGSAKKALEGDSASLAKIKELMKVVDEYVKEPVRDKNAPFLMPVESVVIAQGRGTVVTGKIERGQIKAGDSLELITSRQIFKTVCMSLEMYKKILEFAQVGDNVGVLLKNVPNKEVIKGDMLVAPGTMRLVTKFKARIYVLSGEEGGRSKPFKTGYKPQFFFRVSNITGKVILDETVEVAKPGEDYVITVEFVKKVVINEGLRFIMREGKLTIGTGIITEIINF